MSVPIAPGDLFNRANGNEVGDAGKDKHYAEDGGSEGIEVEAGFWVWLECFELERIVVYFWGWGGSTTDQSNSFTKQEDDVLFREYFRRVDE